MTTRQQFGTAVSPRSTRQLEASGVTEGVRTGCRWRRTSRGFYVPAGTLLTPAQRVVELGPLVPAGGAITGWAAAHGLGVESLDGRDDRTMIELRPTILLGADIGRRHLSSVRYRRAALNPTEVVERFGLPLTAAFRTCVEAVLETPNLVEAVVVIDAIAHALGLDLTELLCWCRCRGDLRGLGRVREAIEWADGRSASSWETRLRMFYRREALLPTPLVNQPVFDLDERLLGVPDLLDVEAGLATEFDGRGHRERRQHRADNLREEELEGANLVVCRVDSLDFRQGRALAVRLRARHAQGLARDASRDRWTLEQPEWWRRRRRTPAADRARTR